MTTAARETLSDLDRRALELAIEIDRERSKGCREQIDDKLRSEPWLEVAQFCAQRCQEFSLRLAPWEAWPPSVVGCDDADEPGFEHRGISQSAALLRRMSKLGISRFHPDPPRAIEAAEAEARKKAPRT